MKVEMSRRGALALAAAVTAGVPDVAFAASVGPSLSSRAHFQVRPGERDALVHCLSEVIGLGPPAKIHVPEFPQPILAFRFPGGGSLSVEITHEALEDAQAHKGAWLEIICEDPATLENAILAAGYRRLTYAATNTFYFAAPGGQVFGILGRTQGEALPPGVTVTR